MAAVAAAVDVAPLSGVGRDGCEGESRGDYGDDGGGGGCGWP